MQLRAGLRAHTSFPVFAGVGRARRECRAVEVSPSGIVLERDILLETRPIPLIVRIELRLPERLPTGSLGASHLVPGPAPGAQVHRRVQRRSPVALAEHLDLQRLRGWELEIAMKIDMNRLRRPMIPPTALAFGTISCWSRRVSWSRWRGSPRRVRDLGLCPRDALRRGQLGRGRGGGGAPPHGGSAQRFSGARRPAGGRTPASRSAASTPAIRSSPRSARSRHRGQGAGRDQFFARAAAR